MVGRGQNRLYRGLASLGRSQGSECTEGSSWLMMGGAARKLGELDGKMA